MTIVLTPDLQQALAEEARRQGTTPERLALDYLRERLLSTDEAADPPSEGETLADFLAGYVGVLSSSEHVPGGANLSEDTGRRFADELVKQREQGRL